MKKVRFNIFLYGKVAAILLMLLVIFMPSPAVDGAKRGLVLCSEVIIPSTFVFMVLATFLARLGKFGKMPIVFAFFIGMLSGYPVGARYVTEMKAEGNITLSEGQKCLAFCVGAGPAFTVTAVGKGIFSSFSVGLIIFVSQLLSCLLFGIAVGAFKLKETAAASASNELSLSECFVSSVKDSCISCLHICGFVILFSTIIGIVSYCGVTAVLSSFLAYFGIKENIAEILIRGIMEVTNGCAMGGRLSRSAVIAVSSIIGFGGFSVFFQIAAVTSKSGFKMGKFILSRIIIAIMAAIITSMLLNIFTVSVETVSLQNISVGYTHHSLPVCIVLAIFTTALLISDKRKGEISINP